MAKRPKNQKKMKTVSLEFQKATTKIEIVLGQFVASEAKQRKDLTASELQNCVQHSEKSSNTNENLGLKTW